MANFIKKKWTAPLYWDAAGEEEKSELLWGDSVRILDKSQDLWKVKVRGSTGYVRPSHVGTKALLELYFIDVGQGDGVLIRTPDGRHILIDGGWPRRGQPTGKNAADFVDWKFARDYGRDAIKLDAMICSHNDQDHYGGLWDLLDKTQYKDELDVKEVHIENFYHAGLSWWKSAGGRTLGPSIDTNKGMMWTRLLGDRASLTEGLKSTGSQPKLQGEWAKFLRKVKAAKTTAGAPTPVMRLSDELGNLPGFGEDNDVTIRILGPVEFDVDGSPTIRKFSGGESINTNGNSVLLRLDYKAARIVLTGDLNKNSQQSLLEDYKGQGEVFKCDVAKACHHGSDDVSITFLGALEPTCTIISSGDTEGHDHPRPNIVAASGLTGFKTVKNDELITPLVYSTELARSIALGKIVQLNRLNANEDVVEEITGRGLDRYETKYKVVMAGARGAKTGTAGVRRRPVAARTTYGLINVRTDGETILFAALNEKEFKWNVTTVDARF